MHTFIGITQLENFKLWTAPYILPIFIYSVLGRVKKKKRKSRKGKVDLLVIDD